MPPVLLTKDKPVRTLEDLQGMLVRVTSKQDVAYVEALGASAVAQPVNVINQNLANGVIDAIAIGPSAIRSFKLNEPANYLTTWFPGSGSAFVLLLNNDVWDGLSDEQKGWVDAASEDSLSMAGGVFYDKAGGGGLKLAADSGVEIIDLSDDEIARWNAALEGANAAAKAQMIGDMKVGDIIDVMQGN